MKPKLCLVIPVFNESGNIRPLIKDIANLKKTTHCPHQLVLVNNGSTDSSAQELKEATEGLSWITTITLNPNVGYGGGIQAGLEARSKECTHLGWIPADRQYSPEDLYKVWTEVCEKPNALHKGRRTVRLDGRETRFISKVYTALVKTILGLPIKDVNGLPKIFPVNLYEKISFPLANSFHLDGQILMAAYRLGLPIQEHPVTFYARREGVSSWSSKKFQVYRETILALFRIRRESSGWFDQKQQLS